MTRISRIHSLELRQEQVVGHGDAELAALDGFGTFVGGFELRVHPLVAEEAGAVLGDAVAAHQADGFAHHVRAVAGVPELAGGAEDVGDAIEMRQAGSSGSQRAGRGASADAQRLRDWRCACCVGVSRASVLQGIELVEDAGGFEAEGGAGLAGGPDVHQAVHHVLFELQAEFVARGARAGRWSRRGNGRGA